MVTQSLAYDVDAIGGTGGLGGIGGNNPLLWLITLGFLKGDNGLFGGNNTNAGAGVLAGETQAKLDCLAQGQSTLQNQMSNQHGSIQDQLNAQTTANQFQNLGLGIDSLANITRDQTAALTAQLNDLRAQNAECCCETKVAIQEVNTNMALQTAALTAEGKNNTQAILNKLCENESAIKDAEIRRLQDALQTQTIINHGGGNGGNSGIDINLLLRQMQGQGQAS